MGRHVLVDRHVAQYRRKSKELPQRRDVHFSVAVLGRRSITTNGSVYETLIEHWDGTSWSIVSSPNGSTTQDNFLGSVSVHLSLAVLGGWRLL